MRAAVVALLLVVGFLSPLPWAGPAGASAREWVVSGSEVLNDLTLSLDENITIPAGCRLSLENVTLRFNSTEGSPLVLEVQAGGELVLRNSSLDWNGTGPYLVRALPGSKLAVSGCTVAHAGTCATVPALSGFLVATDLSTIDNTTFKQGAAGLYLRNCSPPVDGCQFLADTTGAVVDGSAPSFRRCGFQSGSGDELRLQNGSTVSALDTALDPSGVSLADGSSRLDILWSVAVTVAWDDGPPAAGALVSVKPSDGPALLFQADAAGIVARAGAKVTTVTSAGQRDHGPFNISAESDARGAWDVMEISSELDVLLTLDRTPPLVTIENPAEGARLNGAPRHATGTAFDPYRRDDLPGIALVEARLDDGTWSAANGTSAWSFGLPGLSEGFHTLTVRARDLSGNSNQSAVGFEVDLTAPTLEVWPPAGHLTSGRNLTVRITTDGDTVAFNGTPLGSHAPGVPLEVDWPLGNEGANRAAVESTDLAGNTARSELLAVRDTLPPEVAFTSPPAFSVLDASLVSVSGRCSDPHGIVLVETGPDLENWTRVCGTEQWSFPAVLKEGQNTVYVRATDGAGNTATGWLRLDLRLPDTSPPELRVLHPEDGQPVDDPALEVTVRAADAGGVQSVRISLDGINWTNATGPGDWTARLTLRPGPNTIQVSALDLSGNVNTTSVSVVYTPPPPDGTPPVLVLLYPPSGLKVGSGKLVVSGHVSDSSGVTAVELSTDGIHWTACVIAGEDWSGTVTLSPGTNTIRVRAADAAGNLAETSTPAVYEKQQEPLAGPSDFSLLAVLILLALTAIWLLSRPRPPPGGNAAGRPSEED